MSNDFVVPAIVAVTLVTVGIGFYGLRLARTTSDFLVASRAISPTWNAAAIGGEYLSAASFLGIAGLVLKDGVDVLWYPVGFAAGYLALLLFVAAPLRRSGAFTLPDFCELRLGSRRLRILATAFVIFIGWLYLVPQLQGAGLTLATVAGSPYPVGALLVAAVVTANVALGGMRAITFVQAFQYWLKLTALAVPVIFLALQWQADGRPAVTPPDGPTFRVATTVVVEHRATLTLPDGEIREVRPGDELTFAAGDPVPDVSGVAADASDWLLPSAAGDDDRGLFATYSLILATFLGTMGLPHVLVRFYTNPDGAAARRTTLVVLALVGAFYLLPTLYGVLGRIYTPQLLVSGQTDAVVVLLPGAALGDGTVGRLLAALVAAGAFAAFLSTVVRAADQRRRGDLDGRARPRLGTRLPSGHGDRRSGADGAGAARLRAGRVAGGRAGLRGRRVELLPAAGARHLVAWPDRPGRRRRCAGRRRGGDRRGAGHGARPAAVRLAGHAHHPAGRLDGAVGLHRDGRGVHGHPPPCPRRRRGHHAPPAHPGSPPDVERRRRSAPETGAEVEG